MSAFLCPTCAAPTTYAAFSGGEEYYCPRCDTNGFYPENMENPPRARLLRTEEGRAELRRQMYEILRDRA